MADTDVRRMPADISERQRLGHDRRDEAWQGVYRMVPPGPHIAHARVDAALARLLDAPAQRAGLVALTPFNLGERLDHRVPDGGYVLGEPDAVYLPTAAIVVEFLSDDDDTFAKFGFYAGRGVWEVLVADPAGRTVRCWHLEAAALVERERSDLLGVAMADLTRDLPWPGRA